MAIHQAHPEEPRPSFSDPPPAAGANLRRADAFSVHAVHRYGGPVLAVVIGAAAGAFMSGAFPWSGSEAVSIARAPTAAIVAPAHSDLDCASGDTAPIMDDVGFGSEDIDPYAYAFAISEREMRLRQASTPCASTLQPLVGVP